MGSGAGSRSRKLKIDWSLARAAWAEVMFCWAVGHLRKLTVIICGKSRYILNFANIQHEKILHFNYSMRYSD